MISSVYRTAGFGIRFIASLIDSLLLAILIVPLLLKLYGPAYFLTPPDQMNTANLLTLKGPADLIITYLLPLIIILIFWFYRAATPGKFWLNLKIIDATTGNAPTKRQCVIRYLGYYVSLLPFGLGFWWILWDKRHQGWHDKLARTLVVH